VRLWEASPFKERGGLPDDAHVSSVAFSPGGTFLACAGGSNVGLWLVSDLLDDKLGPALAEVRKFGSYSKRGRGWRVELNDKADDAALEKLKALPVVELRFGFAPGRRQARSLTPVTPACRAQWAQQKKRPPCSTPWPSTLQPQWAQAGASAWMAHSNESKVCVRPAMVTSNALS
jgi:hypothetical protein